MLHQTIDAHRKDHGFYEAFEVGNEFGGFEYPADKSSNLLFKAGVRLMPGSVDLGFAGGFEHVAPGAIAIDGPCADQRLIQEIFGMPIRQAVLPGVGIELPTVVPRL